MGVNTSGVVQEEQTKQAEATEMSQKEGTVGLRVHKLQDIVRGEERLGTFVELTDGCSRGVRARRFYHLLQLVSAGLVRVRLCTIV